MDSGSLYKIAHSELDDGAEPHASLFVSLSKGTEPEHSLQITETEHSGSSSQRPARLLPSWPFWLTCI
jgi:hypothetical protein